MTCRQWLIFNLFGFLKVFVWLLDVKPEVSDDGVFHYLYSDHCSFLELVQFLQFLPKAPVTFISPVGSSEGTYSFDGADGIQKLMASASVPSIRYSERPTRCFEKTSLPRAKRKAEGPHEEDGYEQKKSAGA